MFECQRSEIYFQRWERRVSFVLFWRRSSDRRDFRRSPCSDQRGRSLGNRGRSTWERLRGISFDSSNCRNSIFFIYKPRPQSKIMTILPTLILLFCLSTTVSSAYDWTKVQDTVNSYLQEGAFAGGILRVSNGTSTIYNLPFGQMSHHQIPYGSPTINNNTMFDMASVTKVTATLASIMRLHDLKKVGIDDKITKFIPQYHNNGKQHTTVRNLLLHNAGLLPDYPGTLPKTKQEVMKWTYNCQLNYPIGTKFVYSDLSFILLGQIVERVAEQSLETFAKDLMTQIGMHNTSFLPDLNKELYRIAPTEYSVFRKGLIRGVVHDPTAYLFKGVAGHAGFFSVVQDMEAYMQVHLNKGVTRQGKRIYETKTVQTFYQREDGLPYNNRRALGWDTVPIQDNPPCGHYFSPNSFGHTGYTGTSIWADRDKNLIIVLLTQRVHPTSLNTKIIKARADISNAIVKAMGFV